MARKREIARIKNMSAAIFLCMVAKANSENIRTSMKRNNFFIICIYITMVLVVCQSCCLHKVYSSSCVQFKEPN